MGYSYKIFKDVTSMIGGPKLTRFIKGFPSRFLRFLNTANQLFHSVTTQTHQIIE
jgi:hypothetical protein